MLAREKFDGPHVWGNEKTLGRVLKKFVQQGRSE
jgi:hypothetical protein